MKQYWLVLTLIMMSLSACNLTSTSVDEASSGNRGAEEAPVANTPVINNSAPTAPTECVPRTDWAIYEVQPGDNLTIIANKIDATVDDLVAANCLLNPNNLMVGQVLYLPRAIGDSSPTKENLQTASTTIHTDPLGFALDYPTGWTYRQNNDGLPGGVISSFPPSQMPSPDVAWSDHMVMISWVHLVEGVAPASFDLWIDQAVQDFENAATYQITYGPSNVAFQGGLRGVQINTNNPGTPSQHYYFVIDSQFVIIQFQGNTKAIQPILTTLRGTAIP